MFEHKQKQGFEFIHIWPKWKLYVSIYLNANNRVGLTAAVSISASLSKAELLLLKLIHLFARKVLLVQKMEIKETKTT